jgi:hypothetical protein
VEDRKSFSWGVQKHLQPFAVPSAKKTPLTINEATSLSELHLPSWGGYSLMWTQNIPHWEKGVVMPVFFVSNINKPCKHTLWLARASKGLH